MTLHILIDGWVQGVGFRQFVKSYANRLNLTGWVRNLPDHRVEVMLSGNQENLRKMIKICKRGPFLARVKNIQVNEKEEQNFETFQIIKQTT